MAKETWVSPYVSVPERTKIILGKVSYSSGTPSIVWGGSDFSITDAGTGLLTITPNEPGATLVFMGGGVEDDTDCYVLTLAEATTETSLQLLIYNDAGSAADPDGGIVHFAFAMCDVASN